MTETINVRPVGVWRFLTPLETVQEGDLGRTSGLDSKDRVDTDWTPVNKESRWIIDEVYTKVVGVRVPPDGSWEFIRAVDGTFVQVEAKNGN